MTRRWWAVLVVFGLMVAACGGGSDEPAASPTETAPQETEPTPEDVEPPPTPEPPPVEPGQCEPELLDQADGPVQVELWHAMSAINEEVLASLIDEYNAAQDRVEVTEFFQGPYEDTFAKFLNTLRSGGDLPDAIQLNETMFQQMIDSQSIVPVQACIDASGYDTSDFAPALLGQYQVGGVLVTMPFQVSNPVLYYDGDDFVAAGLDPDAPPTTFDDVVAVSRALVDAGVVEKGIALENDSWLIEQWISKGGGALVDNDNGRSARATAPLLDSPEATATFGFLDTLLQEDLLIDTGRGTDQAAIDKYLALAFGDAAMTIGTSANLGEIYNQLGQFPNFDLRVAPLPGPTEGGTAIGGGSLYLLRETDPEVRAAVWDLMAWLNEPEQQVAWSADTGYIPTRISAIDDADLQALWTERPGFRVAFDQLDQAGPIVGGGGPVIGDYVGVREAIEQAIEALVGGASVADAQAQAQAQAAEAITDYNRRIGE